MKDDQHFPIDIVYGLSRMFRVRMMGVARFQVEQKVERRKDDGTPAEWNVLAISNSADANEAIEVMRADQMQYALEIKKRRELIKLGVPNGVPSI